MKAPSAVVVDTRDGYTWANDGNGLMDTAAANVMAKKYNDACKDGKRTYAVYTLTLATPAPDAA